MTRPRSAYGKHLAELRKGAGLTQVELSPENAHINPVAPDLHEECRRLYAEELGSLALQSMTLFERSANEIDFYALHLVLQVKTRRWKEAFVCFRPEQVSG